MISTEPTPMPPAIGNRATPGGSGVSRPVAPSGRSGDGVNFPAVLIALASLAAPGGVRPEGASGSVPARPTADPSATPAELLVVAGSEAPTPGTLSLPDLRVSDSPVPFLATEPEGAESDEPELESTVLAEIPLPQVAVDTVTLSRQMIRGLQPRFRSGLERVAGRMFEEHGMRIEIVEGIRGEARQRELYAQGRTAPGPVVTWTTRSLHLVGAAADVTLNGGPVTGEGAVVLSRVAREEGLRTLYPYDSGHIQLDDVPGRQAPEGRIDRPPIPGPGSGATPRSGVAVPAPVARPAQPARPAGPGFDGAISAQAPDRRDGRDGREQTAKPPEPGHSDRSVGETGNALAESGRPASPAAGPGGRTDLQFVSSLRGPNLEAWEPAARAPIQRILVPIEPGTEGGVIRIGMQGGVVHAELSVPDGALVERLRRTMHELRRGLGERGIEVGALSARLGGEIARAGTESGPASRHHGGGSGDAPRDDDGLGRNAPHDRERRRGSRTSEHERGREEQP